jgi:hypothetical protein
MCKFNRGLGANIQLFISPQPRWFRTVTLTEIPNVSYRQPLLRHEVVLNNCFTGSYSCLIKPAIPLAVSYRGTGCMVQPLSGEAPGKQYRSPARAANGGAENREEDSLWSLNAN